MLKARDWGYLKSYMAKLKIFLDSSILITSLLSNKGGSFYILHNFSDKIHFQTNEYVIMEVQEVLKKKFPNKNMLTDFFLLLGVIKMEILSNPKKTEITKLQKYISKKDIPILASAIKSSDYLLTLDNEFFNKKIINKARDFNLSILKPKEFIKVLNK